MPFSPISDGNQPRETICQSRFHIAGQISSPQRLQILDSNHQMNSQTVFTAFPAEMAAGSCGVCILGFIPSCLSLPFLGLLFLVTNTQPEVYLLYAHINLYLNGWVHFTSFLYVPMAYSHRYLNS